jgi:Tfp pilus assembly protein PilO
MKKPAIPSLLPIKDASIAAVLAPMKENIEIINGSREGLLVKLPTDATLPQAVAKINEIINRLNFYE